MNKLTLTILSALAAVGLSGCVLPVPHTSQRSPEVRGRVIDSVTQLPVRSARVALHEHPSIAARSDRSGFYHIRATHNIHLVTFLGICSSDFPLGKYYFRDELDVSHPRYQRAQIQARQYQDTQTNGTLWVLRDI